MNTLQQISVRRALTTHLKVGGSVVLKIPGVPPQAVAELARRFGKTKKRNFNIETKGETVTVYEYEVETSERPIGRPRLPADRIKYPIGTLEVGESVLIEEPPENHPRIRKSVSARTTVTRWKYSCKAEPGGIRVTRTA